MSPTIIGLILAIPLSWSTGKLSVGMAFRRVGLLTTPEERRRPSVVERTAEILTETGGMPDEPANGLALLYDDPSLQAAHGQFDDEQGAATARRHHGGLGARRGEARRCR